MPARRRASHQYTVFTNSYADEGVKARVERGEEIITQPDQLGPAAMAYMGSSERQAGYAFYQACRVAFGNPLAFSVTAYRDREIIAKVISSIAVTYDAWAVSCSRILRW
jgi:hypothetical protein